MITTPSRSSLRVCWKKLKGCWEEGRYRPLHEIRERRHAAETAARAADAAEPHPRLCRDADGGCWVGAEREVPGTAERDSGRGEGAGGCHRRGRERPGILAGENGGAGVEDPRTERRHSLPQGFP